MAALFHTVTLYAVTLLLLLLGAAPSLQQPSASLNDGLPSSMQEVYKYIRRFHEEELLRQGVLPEEPFVTMVINLNQITVTKSSISTVTATQFQTCTAVSPGTPPCPALTTLAPATLTETTDASPPTATSTDGSATAGLPPKFEENSISSFPMLLPSCNCRGSQSPRTPRRMAPQDQEIESPMIFLTKVATVFATTTSTIIDPATTVAITYGGCVPTDAVTTVACAP